MKCEKRYSMCFWGVVAATLIAAASFVLNFSHAAGQSSAPIKETTQPAEHRLPYPVGERVKEHSSQRKVERTSKKVERRFDIEGVSLGMTTFQASTVMRRESFDSSESGGPVLEFSHYNFNTGSIARILMSSNDRSSSLNQIDQVRWEIEQESDEVKQQRYQRLVAKYGEPDRCNEHRMCTWVRHLDGWDE
jgi:hypothetical protein